MKGWRESETLIERVKREKRLRSREKGNEHGIERGREIWRERNENHCNGSVEEMKNKTLERER